MTDIDLLELANMESEDEELLPEILPVDARLALHGPRDILVSLFERIVNVVPKKEITPGTEYALLETFAAEAGTAAYAQVTATDGEQSLVALSGGLHIIMAGGALVPPKRILEVLKLAPEEHARIEVLGTTLTIRSGRAQWSIQTPVGDSLPPLPDTSSIVLHEIPRVPFLEALVAARRAASTSTARSALMQVLIREGAITGCDGSRVHQQRFQGLPDTVELTVPLNSVDELIRALRSSGAAGLRLGENHNHMVFHVDEDILIAQRMVLPFPDMKMLLIAPKLSNTQTLTVPRTQLSDVVKRVRVNADPDFAGVFLLLTPGKKADDGTVPWKLTVRARDKIGNAAQETIDVTWDGGTKPRELCVNHKHLLDLLSVYPTGDIVFKLGEDTKARRSPIYVEDGSVGFVGVLNQMTGVMLK